MNWRVVTSRPWLLGGVLGFVFLLVIYVLVAATGGISTDDGGVLVTILAVLLISTLGGFLPGAALGGLVGFVKAKAAPRAVPHDDAWALLQQRCETAVQRFHSVSADTDDPSVKSWLADVGERLDDELVESRKLTSLGRRLDPTAGAHGPNDRQVQPLWDRVVEASNGFDNAAAQAVAIRVSLADDDGPDLTEVKAQLDVLSQQLPQLRN
ncbi:YrzE family protein [Antrihabitans cavernicola]|uniref:Uncharacterized protein n=1 Tax=Antrihabitans cavernicola TaxID=2495913 RepID=A0A5A7SEA1_9NOCA|nr:YrzE family protein [Spelaeibacter cavernicola]KAA0023027.1 hypothetical protein FOY51_11070 [Spelaeibacter cavernicola]